MAGTSQASIPDRLSLPARYGTVKDAQTESQLHGLTTIAMFNTVRPAPTTKAHPQAISAHGSRQRDAGLLNAFVVECLVADAADVHIRAEHGAYLRRMAGLDADGGLRMICAALWLTSFVGSRWCW